MLVSQEADLNFILPSLYFAKFLRNPLTSTEKLSKKKKAKKKKNKTKQNKTTDAVTYSMYRCTTFILT